MLKNINSCLRRRIIKHRYSHEVLGDNIPRAILGNPTPKAHHGSVLRMKKRQLNATLGLAVLSVSTFYHWLVRVEPLQTFAMVLVLLFGHAISQCYFNRSLKQIQHQALAVELAKTSAFREMRNMYADKDGDVSGEVLVALWYKAHLQAGITILTMPPIATPF